jgi:hypothetical protein
LNWDKLHLAQQEISFLGHSVSAQGIKVLPERVEAIRNFSPPKNLKAVRKFLGMAGVYGRFICRTFFPDRITRGSVRMFGSCGVMPSRPHLNSLKMLYPRPLSCRFPTFLANSPWFAMKVLSQFRQFFSRRREMTWRLSPIAAVYCLLPREDILFTRSVLLWYMAVRSIVLTLIIKSFASIPISPGPAVTTCQRTRSDRALGPALAS